MAVNRYDCVVIGGGPAGSTAAALLAQAGRRVLIAEKAVFPRFHIGESLIPAGNRVLRKMGAWERIEKAGFLKKVGAEFTCGTGEKRVHNRFSEGLVKGLDYTYQVDREHFDQLLLDCACESGVELRQPVEARIVSDSADSWEIELKGTEGVERVQTPWVLDAAGRGRMLGRYLNIPTDPIPLPKRFAVYNHFKNVARAPGPDGGNIIVTRIPAGWFWSIPLDEERTSVGLVTMAEGERLAPAEVFAHKVASNPYVRTCMAKAEPLGEYRVEADYSFVHQQFVGKRWLMLGDAVGFIDPVFSSGIYLAVESADMAVDAILHANERKGLSSRVRRHYERQMRASMRVMQQLVEMFYDDRTFAVFMNPTEKLGLFQAVNAVVGGSTRMSFGLRWRFALFLLICRLNRKWDLVPPLNLRNDA